MKEKKKKRKLKWQVKLFIIIVIFLLYCFYIGPKGIFIKEYKIDSNKISENMDGFKILHISDIHYGSTVNIKDIKNIVKKANSTKPDIIIFTGDLIKKEYKISDEEAQILKKELNKLDSELGNFYIEGDDDTKISTSILDLSNFINLKSNYQIIYDQKNNPILLIDKENSKKYFEENKDVPNFKILAIHNPEDIDNLKELNFDIALAGHTLNGLINIPKIKNLFIIGKYKNTYQKINNTKLYINPGIGTKKIGIRLFNHPTMYLYRLNKTSTN